ncbi:hypothetical protein SDC9_123036 [bioreactor metagenome]|uniref:Uncharacterized protein n=1 Tax=bioreactor metagenome TaxID=1076179 RepID=A0A645CGJ3_9ZZZZ
MEGRNGNGGFVDRNGPVIRNIRTDQRTDGGRFRRRAGGRGKRDSVVHLHGGRTLPLERRDGADESVRTVRQAGPRVSPHSQSAAAARKPG